MIDEAIWQDILKTQPYGKILDSENNIVAAGKIVQCKVVICDKEENIPYDFKGISFDNKWFFNLDSKNIRFETNPDELKISFDKDRSKSIKTELYKNYTHNKIIDVYRENDMTELDPEVIQLVNAINQCDGMRTTGSCSGHNTKRLWISIFFREFQSIYFLTRLIQDYFENDFILSTEYGLRSNDNESIAFVLSTVSVGEKAYKKANQLAQIINLSINN